MGIELQQLAFRNKTSDKRDALAGLLDILTNAQRRHQSSVLTGAIALSGSRYLQVLEGEAEAIEATFAQIDVDPRHDDIEIVARRSVVSRSFGSWSLASPAMQPDLRLQIDLAISASEADYDHAIALLRSVVTAQQRDRNPLPA